MQQRDCTRQKTALLMRRDFANELYSAAPHKWGDHVVEPGPVSEVQFGRNFQRNASPLSHADRDIESFLRRNAAEKGEIIPWRGTVGKGSDVDAVIDGSGEHQ